MSFAQSFFVIHLFHYPSRPNTHTDVLVSLTTGLSPKPLEHGPLGDASQQAAGVVQAPKVITGLARGGRALGRRSVPPCSTSANKHKVLYDVELWVDLARLHRKPT